MPNTRSTEFAILLPSPPTRALLRAFWLVLVSGSVLLVATLLVTVGSLAVVEWYVLLGAAVLIAIPGLIFPYEVVLPYRAWNWLGRRFSRFAVRYVTEVSLRTVVSAMSLGGRRSAVSSADAGSTMWRRRSTQSDSSYRSLFADGENDVGRPWLVSFGDWVLRDAPPLAWTLIPFVALIRQVHVGERESELGQNIYTLY